MICTFWRCFCGDLLRRASSLALSSQSGRRGRPAAEPGAAAGRKPGRLGALGAVGAAGRTGSPGLRGASAPGLVGGRRGPSGAGPRAPGFWSCINSPGATGLRMAPGAAGLPAWPGLVGGAAGSRRIGFPTSSRDEAGGLPSGSPRRGWAGAPARFTGAPGRWGAAGAPARWGAGRWGVGGRIGTAGRFWSPPRGAGAGARPMSCWPPAGRPAVG
jgi:hypothetical protein